MRLISDVVVIVVGPLFIMSQNRLIYQNQIVEAVLPAVKLSVVSSEH